jgi:hypothetical protein
VTVTTPVTTAEPVTEPVTVTDPATPPLWHARRVTAGAAQDASEAAEALRVFGLMPDQLAGESAELLQIVDFDAAREVINSKHEEEPVTVTEAVPDVDTSPAAVRAWAKQERLRVASLGKIPQAIMNAYLAAHGVPLAEQARIARPTSAPLPAGQAKPKPAAPKPAPSKALRPPTTAQALDTLPEPAVTVPAPDVTPEPAPVTPPATGVTVEDLREQLDRLGAAFSAKQAEVARLIEERDRLQRGGAELGRQIERYLTWVLDATAMHDLIDEEGDGDWQLVWERLAELRPELEQVRAELAQQREENAGHLRKIARLERAIDLPLLPEPIADLLNAWHRLFEKASRVETEAGHTIAELALPALVTETADHVHDLIRLLDGDVTR